MIDSIRMQWANKVPPDNRRDIISRNLIGLALNNSIQTVPLSPMEELFDMYHTFFDNPHLDDWTCYSCRQEVLEMWHKLLPVLIHLEKLENGSKGEI